MPAVAAWAVRHARAVVAVALLVALAAGFAATRLPSDAGTATLIDRDEETFQATEEVRRIFGEEPVVILAEGDLPRLVLTTNLLRMLRLEGCLSGRVPKGAEPLPGACAELARLRPVEFVAGPGTFLNEAVIQIERQLRRLSREVSPERFREFLLAVAARYGITSVPSLTNEEFIATVVFDLAQPRGTPKARLSYLFPNERSAQIVVRLKPDLSDSERERALRLIERAVHDTTPRQACAERGKPAPCFQLRGGSYVVSGAPVVVDGVSRALREALLVLFAVAIVVMALALLVVFASRMRLLPLALALAAAAISFGLWGLFGGELTMATIAVLPILIGLAVDYAIQFQARFDEAFAELGDPTAAARRAAAAGGRTIAVACLATGAGFLALQLSPTPMVRGFGLLLLLGIAVAFALALSVGFAALSLRDRLPAAAGGPRGDRARGRLAGVGEALARGRGAVGRGGERLLGYATEWPERVLLAGLVLSLAGWLAGTQVGTVSDIRSLAPQDLPAVRDLNRLQETTGVSGQLDVLVEAPDFADPATIQWMAAFKQRALRANGFGGENPSCREAQICPGPALSDFLLRGGGQPTRADLRATLEALSPYALRQVAPRDPVSGEVGNAALLAFGIRAQSLDDQRALIERVRDAVGEPGEPGGPPPEVRVRIAGLAAIAAEAAGDLSASRYWLTLAGLLAVGLVLLLAYRSLARALLPLVPTALATGWASLVLWITGIPLNPMSAALGALTIAIATEFAVILSGRFHEELGAGREPLEALQVTYRRTGAAVMASAATAIAGFAVLIASDFQMLRDFGLVTVVDLSVALLGVVVVLPAALVWIEER